MLILIKQKIIHQENLTKNELKLNQNIISF